MLSFVLRMCNDRPEGLADAFLQTLYCCQKKNGKKSKNGNLATNFWTFSNFLVLSFNLNVRGGEIVVLYCRTLEGWSEPPQYCRCTSACYQLGVKGHCHVSSLSGGSTISERAVFTVS